MKIVNSKEEVFYVVVNQISIVIWRNFVQAALLTVRKISIFKMVALVTMTQHIVTKALVEHTMLNAKNYGAQML